MNTQSASNRIWLQEKLRACGLVEPLALLAAREIAGDLRHPAPWAHNYCLAYSEGHNTHRLSGKRLDHYASAYADICETFELEIPPDRFYRAWNEGATFEGTCGEHWHLA